MDICTITAEQARPLRNAVLRPDGPLEDSVYPGDDDDEALHLGLYDADTLIATATIVHQPPPGSDDVHAWRLRGMAVHESYRNQGHGARLLEIALAYVSESAGTQLWCNAREPARAFYERNGFLIHGDRFEAARSGPHFLMVKRL